MFFDVTAPNVVPAVAKELLDQKQNRDSFWDRPIVSRRLEKKPPEEQFTEYTSRTAKFLGEMFGKSHPKGGPCRPGAQ